MAAVCQVTGAVPGFGHNISHSHRRTKRRFDPNVQKKTYFVPSLGRKVTLNVSAKGIKVIDVRGIENVVKDLKCRVGGKEVKCVINTRWDAQLELWGAKRKRELFEKVFKRPITFEVAR